MKKIAFYITAASAAMFIPSCSREMTESPQGLKTITNVEACIGEIPLSRTHMEGTDMMMWDEWDGIGIFSDTDDPVPFYNQGGNLFCSLHGESVSGHEFHAYFPYSSIQLQSNRKELFLYNYIAGTGKNPSLDIPMVARYDGSSFAFKHTAGILHFSITGSQTLKSITLKSNAGEPVCGPSRINLEEETPILRCEGADGYDDTTLWLDNIVLSKEEPLDVWFVLPPVTLSKGFTLVVKYEGGRAEKSTEKSVTLSRATIKNYTLVDLDQLIEEYDAILDAERDALIAFYNAMDGPHWINNTNWCTDKPLNEWFGVSTDSESGRVTNLIFEQNGLQGALPSELSNLKLLTDLRLIESNGRITNIEQLGELTSLETLFFGIGNNWVREYDHVKTLMFAVPANISNLKNLNSLTLFGINDELPEELFGMENLESLYLRFFNTGRPLQRGLGKLKNLKYLSITSICENKIPGSNPLCGEFPDDIYDLKNLELLEMIDTHVGGQLSPRIGELTKLQVINLAGNKFSGPLPAELANLHLIDNTVEAGPGSVFSPRILLSENAFSGKVPEAFRNWPEWQKYWGYIVYQNNLDFKEVMPMIVPFEATTLTGETVSSEQFSERELTIMFQTASWCPFSPPVIAEMKEIYPMYKDRGLEVICYSAENRSTVQAFADSYGFTWPTVSTSYEDNWPMGFDNYPVNVVPCISIFDKTGQLVFVQFGAEGEWVSFVENYLGASANLYESSDYSADGTVHTLQTATRGAGIDIVLMGDGYSDRLIADGTYASVMQRATEAFFSEEPYKSFRDCFNVYYVDVVSKNERYTAETALDTWYGTWTKVGGNDAKAVEYARKVIPDSRMDDATVIVLMNRDYYAGTCYMYPFADGDYGRGLSISYFPVSSFETTFSGLVSHEAGGHGFGKLADEYYYASNGTILQDKIDEYSATAAYGWWRNGDFTSNPAAVKWSAFLTDDRYSAEGLGVYEGAFTYCYGAWRPTRNSIMNDNTGGYNAPSRYAIWYKIGKLAYGADWNGTYEDFVAWDAINRTSASHAPRKAQPNYVEKNFQPLAPPVVINHSWRDQ